MEDRQANKTLFMATRRVGHKGQALSWLFSEWIYEVVYGVRSTEYS